MTGEGEMVETFVDKIIVSRKWGTDFITGCSEKAEKVYKGNAKAAQEPFKKERAVFLEINVLWVLAMAVMSSHPPVKSFNQS